MSSIIMIITGSHINNVEVAKTNVLYSIMYSKLQKKNTISRKFIVRRELFDEIVFC